MRSLERLALGVVFFHADDHRLDHDDFAPVGQFFDQHVLERRLARAGFAVDGEECAEAGFHHHVFISHAHRPAHEHFRAALRRHERITRQFEKIQRMRGEGDFSD